MRPPVPNRAPALLLLLLLLAGACAHRSAHHAGGGIRLIVANEAWHAVDVSVSRDGTEENLGRVWRDQHAAFHLAPLPDSRTARLIVTASSRSSGTFRTDTILAAPGSTIDLRLLTPLRHSRWRVH
jgi:hypothetical protein